MNWQIKFDRNRDIEVEATNPHDAIIEARMVMDDDAILYGVAQWDIDAGEWIPYTYSYRADRWVR